MFCTIPMMLIGVIVKLDSKGAAIYRQERFGIDGVPFVMYKFRSMAITAEAHGPQWAEENDNRCTKFGRFLRKIRLDELLQLTTSSVVRCFLWDLDLSALSFMTNLKYAYLVLAEWRF